MKTHSEAFLRQRKFILVLPLLVLPFLTLAFWALGGGTGTSDLPPQAPGLSLQLPGPQLDGKQKQDKLSLYKTQKRELQQQRQEPGRLLRRLGFGDEAVAPGTATDTALLSPGGVPAAFTGHAPGAGTDPNEAKINSRLQQLQHLLQQENTPQRPARQQAAPPSPPSGPPGQGERFSQDVRQLEAMMQAMSGRSPGKGPDPDLQQLEAMLERILDIQHPERVSSRLRQQEPHEERQQAKPLVPEPEHSLVSLLAPPDPANSLQGYTPAGGVQPPGGFQVLETGVLPGGAAAGSLPAAVPETQTLREGATVKVRLQEDALLAGHMIPRGTELAGTCQLRGDRLVVTITAVRLGSMILPVSLAAYGLDGMEGLPVPGTGLQEASRQGADRVLGQGLPLPLPSTAIGAQVAGAGIEAARGLLRKNNKRLKVTLPAGYRLLLRDLQATK